MAKDNRKFVRYQGKNLPIMPRGSPVTRFFTARWRTIDGKEKLCLVKKNSDGSESVLLYDEGLLPAPYGSKKLTIAEAKRIFEKQSKDPERDKARKAKKTFRSPHETWADDVSKSDVRGIDTP